MRRRSTALTALVALMLLGAGLAADAQGVRFVTPEDGDTVRDMVRIQATKPSPNAGWISYKIARGDTGDFVAAVTSPFTYVWNTRARDEEGEDLYPDGQYTLTAVALSGTGAKEGEASITVTLKNSVPSTDTPQTVDLSLFYDRNDEVRYRAEADWAIRPASDEEKPEDVYAIAKVFNGSLVSNWKNKVMSPTYAAGHAVLHVVVGSSGAQAGSSDVEALDNAGEALTYLALKNGEMRPKHDDEPSFELAEITVPLPGRPVKVGDSWQGRMTIWPDPLKGTLAAGTGMTEPGMGGMPFEPGMLDPGMVDPGMADPGMSGQIAATGPQAPTKLETRTVPATHRVDGFEWVMGYPTVRIRSTYSVDDDTVTIPSASAGAVGGAPLGGEPGADLPQYWGGEGPPDMTVPDGIGAGQQGADKDTSYTGERITYWSWELSRPLRIADTITHTLEIERAQAMMGTMDPGGMPMEPGVFDPGMIDPGMMDPGMNPWMTDPSMGFGPGGMQMEPPKPMKVRIRVNLTIEEVGL